MNTKKNALWGSCVIAVVLGQSAGASADVIYSIDVESLYNDNIYLLERNDVDSLIGIVRPDVRLEMKQGANTFAVEAEAESGTYTQSKNGADNYTDYFVKGEGELDFNISNRLQFDAKSERGHDARGTGRMDVPTKTLATLSDTPDLWRHNSVNAMYTLGAKDAQANISFGGGIIDREYMNNGGVQYTKTPLNVFNLVDAGTSGLDHQDAELRAIGRLQVMPRTKLVLEVRTRDINYDDTLLQKTAPSVFVATDRDSTENRYFAGVEWESTAKTTGTIRVGSENKDLDAGPSLNTVAYEAKVVWKPKSYSALTFDAFRGTEDSNNSLSAVDRTFYSLNWHHEWSSRLGSDIYAQTTKDNYQGSPRTDSIDGFGFAALYELTDWMKVKGGYEYSDRNSTVAGLDYEVNKILLGVDFQLR